MENPPHILIVGAGIGGLCAAALLAKQGARVEVFEQADALGEIGAGLQLSANAVHVLSDLGVAGEIFAAGFEPENAVTRHFKTGTAELSFALKGAHRARYGQPYIHIHRADLHGVLLRAARAHGVDIHTGHKVTGASQSSRTVKLFANEQEFSGDVLIGADGIHSAVQACLFDAPKPRFTHQVAWRGVVETAKLPEGTIPPDANAWLGPGRHFVSYFVRGGELINFIAVEERTEWGDEDWHQVGLVEDIRRAFKGWDPRIDVLLQACETCHFWGLFDRAPLKSWAQGRAVLLGDACHPMLPFMAQGAVMAIEDAFVLSREIMARPEHISEALKSYEVLRKPRAAMVQSISRRNAKLFHISTLAGRLLRRVAFAVASRTPAIAHRQFDRIYGVNVTR